MISTLVRWEHWLMEGFWNEHGDPRLRTVPIMGSFRICLSILLFYSIIVLYIGPKLMQNRKPYSLKPLLLFYNVGMCIANALFFFKLLANFTDTTKRMFNFKFPSFLEDKDDLIWFNLAYGVSKVVDLYDTIFFVMRKKESQVTVLHFYHHLSVPFFGWILFRLCGNCNLAVPFMVMNSFLHVLMYGYYGLAALGPAVRPYLWWKRYITLLQIVQFGLLGLHWTLFVTTQEGYSLFYKVNYCLQVSIYIVLFTRFYLKTYFNTDKLNKPKLM